MKQGISLLLCILLLCSLLGCVAQDLPSCSTGGSQNTPPQFSNAEMDLFTLLFDIRNKITLSLDMSDAELAKMQADYEAYDCNGSKSPIYRMANLTVTIQTPDGQCFTHILEEVGVRMKGNTSRTAFYSLEGGIYNQIHLKLSFQETFDDPNYYGSNCKEWTEEDRTARKERTFATLEKLDLRWNRCDDSTYLKEYFAYEAYRQYGVLAPHTNLCSFSWAGIHMGVYTINEPVDNIFLAKNLPAGALGGDLYKLGWAGGDNGSFKSTHSIGIEDEDTGKFYAYDLKTNKQTSTHESLKNLIRTLNRDISKEEFATLVDMDSFLPYCAVSYLLGNPDDLRNNYNNCYIYFRADNGKMMIIPYDYDRCLGITAHWNPTGNGVTGDDPFSATINADGSQQHSPLFLYSVVSGGYYVREYADLLEQIAGGDWFTYENFASLYNIAQSHYASLAAPEKDFHNTGGMHLAFDIDRTSDFGSNGNISFREYWEVKCRTLAFYLEHVEDSAGGDPAIPVVWYIRSDVTNWQNDAQYAMTVEDGLITIRIQVVGSIRLKVYNDQTCRWYGAECISEDCTVPYNSDHHTNICLETGVYHIAFNPETETITLETEE